MITGFNTDIEYEGVIYHVQTEDKGLDTPLILSLVYDRGTILASKRSPYDDLLSDFDEKVLIERLQKQHKLICAAIRGGRIEDLKRMTMRESASRKKGLVVQKEVKKEIPEKSVQAEKKRVPAVAEKVSSIVETVSAKENGFPKVQPPQTKKEDVPLPQILKKADEKFQEIQQPDNPLPSETQKILETESSIFEQSPKWDIPINLSADDLIVEEIEFIEEVTILPAEAVEIITDFSKREEPPSDTLTVELLKETTFKAGGNKTISILVSRGTPENTISGASVVVKILGSNFRPLIFHAKTDSNGVAIVQLHIPNFSRGRAAVLIKALNGNDEAELRRVIQSG